MIRVAPNDFAPDVSDKPAGPRPDPEFIRRWIAAGCPATVFAMALSPEAIRAAKKRARRRRGVICVLDVEITAKQVEWLLDTGRIDEAGSRNRKALEDAISRLIEDFRHA